MGSRIGQLLDPVAGLGQHRAIGGTQDGADRHLAACLCTPRFIQGNRHRAGHEVQ